MFPAPSHVGDKGAKNNYMIGETIIQFYIKDMDDFDKSAIIQTESNFYEIDCNRYDIVFNPNLSDFEIDNYWNVVGTKIMDIGSDGSYTLIALSDKRFIHYDVGGDCISIGVYPTEQYEERLEWFSKMEKLSNEHHYLSNWK
jgi:hypothetical protein